MPLDLRLNLPNNNVSMNTITNTIGDLDYYDKYYTNGSMKYIASGSYGVVYLSTAADGSKAIIKKIFLQTKQIKEEALNEARILHNLIGLNISPEFYAFAIEDKFSILIMEWIDARSLTEVFKDITDKDERKKILHSVDNTLDILHNVGYVHYDIKPDNIMVEKGTNRILLIDFGSTQRIGDEYKNVGQTPHYSQGHTKSPTEFINNYSQQTIVTPEANEYSMNVIKRNLFVSGGRKTKRKAKSKKIGSLVRKL